MTHSNFRSRLFGTALAVIAVSMQPLTADAAIPSTINVQGGLFALSGGPVADGNYNVVFSIYKDAVGGNPVYTEGPSLLTFKNGVYSYAIGSKTPLSAAALAGLPVAFLAMKVESDPEFPRQAMSAVPFSLRASVAEGVDCSGCIGVTQLDPNVLGAYAKSTSLAKVASSGAFADLIGGPDLSSYAKSADLGPYAKILSLAKVATSGAYADLSGLPDLTLYAKAASLSLVATSGKYKDLTGAPVTIAAGTSCGTGLLVQGVKADGTLECIGASAGPIDAKYLPADGISAISNGLVTNTFIETVAGTKGIKIPDASPVGVSDTLDFPDIGIAQTFSVSIDLVNSDISKLSVSVFDPDAVEYVLWNKGGPGIAIKTSYPSPTATLSGDLTTWVGKNPKGKWYLKVVDTGLFNNGFDGAVNSWSLNLKSLSNKKVGVNGALLVTGDLNVGGNTVLNGDVTFKGKISGLAGGATYRWAVWSTYDQWQGWMDNDDPALFGGVNPSTWSDGNAHASQISADKDVQGALFGKKAYAKKNSNVWHDEWRNISSTNSKFAGALFRVRNNTGADIKWTVNFHYSGYAGWGETASVSLNGADTWVGNDDAGASSAKSLDLMIPSNRVSTVIFVSASSPEGSEMRNCTLGFYGDCLKLPNGLEFIDDLDTATGGYEQ